MLLRLRGVGDREAAEQLRDQLVQIPAEEASPLEEDEYYLHQVLGMEVETEEGEPLGEVVEVLSPPDANDVFIVHGLRGELLIPSIEEVILELDLEEGRMVVRPLPGLFGEED
jgi:16S rRNA processing protein RimM